MLRNAALSYSAAKRIKHDLEQPGAAASPAGELAGGQPMLAWLNQSLGQARATEHRRKSTRHNGGQENSFRKTHEKNKAHGASVATPYQATRVSRQELFEAALPGATDYTPLAQALLNAFPDLRLEGNDESGQLVLQLGSLSVFVTANSGRGSGPELDEGWVGGVVRRVALGTALLGASTQLPHKAGTTAIERQHNQDVEHYEQAAKYAKFRETEGVVKRIDSAAAKSRPSMPGE